MSARDEALDLVEKILPFEHAKAYRVLFEKKFDAYAHELAEELRGFGMEDAGNFIDPEVDDD